MSDEADRNKVAELSNPHLRIPPFKKGQKVRRLKDGRLFTVTFINTKGVNCGVFSAESADGKRSVWGGTFPEPSEIEVVA